MRMYNMEDPSRSPLPRSSSPLSIPTRHRSSSTMQLSSLSDVDSPYFGGVPFKPSLLSVSSPGNAYHHRAQFTSASARNLSASVPNGNGSTSSGSHDPTSNDGDARSDSPNGAAVSTEGGVAGIMIGGNHGSSSSVHMNGMMMSPPGGSAESYGTDLFCPQCGKSYRYSRQLEKHMWEHSPAWAIVSQFNYSKNEHCKILDAAEILCSFRQESL